jgi:glycolate oxidase FAD binding subunit
VESRNFSEDRMSSSPSSGSAIAGIEAAWDDLRSIVGPEHIGPATMDDAVNGMRPQMVVEPANQQEVAAVLKAAASAGLRVMPRGAGTKMEWGNPPRAGELILSVRRMDRMLEHAYGDMTATVEAGCTFQQLQETLSAHGQRVALDPLWPAKATVGGILAVNDSGPLRVRFGSLRDLIIGITLVLPDGTVAKSGGKVVKNVAGYDLPKLGTGSLGTLGIITQAIFRLHPTPRECRTLTFSAGDMKAASQFVLAIQASKLVPTGVQIRKANSTPCEIDVRFEGTGAGCDCQTEQLLQIASGMISIDSPGDTWKARETLWDGNSPAAVCKFTLLPTELQPFVEQVTDASARKQWQLVAQGVGVGVLRLETAHADFLADSLQDLRTRLESRGGSLSILRCPPDVKSKMDVWGTAGDALPLMRSIKAQFDPKGTLNPGRFIAGI